MLQGAAVRSGLVAEAPHESWRLRNLQYLYHPLPTVEYFVAPINGCQTNTATTAGATAHVWETAVAFTKIIGGTAIHTYACAFPYDRIGHRNCNPSFAMLFISSSPAVYHWVTFSWTPPQGLERFLGPKEPRCHPGWSSNTYVAPTAYYGNCGEGGV